MRQKDRSEQGYTLVELLVVVAIIGVLLAVLLPVVAGAREKGRQTTCTSNLRQIGMAFRMYLNDYGDQRPPNIPILVPAYLNEPRLLRCASDTTGNYGWLTRTTIGDAKWPCPVSYGYYIFDPWWQPLLKLDSQAGYLFDENHGAEMREVSNVYGEPYPVHGGVTLRLNFDGSVVVRNFPFRYDAHGVGGWSRWEMMTSNPGQPTPPDPFDSLMKAGG